MNNSTKQVVAAALFLAFGTSAWAASTDEQFAMPLNTALAAAGHFAKAYSQRAIPNMENPAARNCMVRGGRIVTFSSRAGTMGACAFGKAVIEEWSLLRAPGLHANEKPNMALRSFLNSSSDAGTIEGNPAAIYCGRSSGSVVTVTDGSGDVGGFCQFKDGSMIEEWTLLRGPRDSDGQRLAAALGR